MRPRPRHLDAHAVLGVTPGASRSEIRRAYRRLALRTHPDVAGADATADMARLNGARDELDARFPGAAPGPGSDPGAGAGGPAAPRRPPEWAAEHAPAWTDHWSAWNELPKRD